MNKTIEWRPTPELNEDLVKMQAQLVQPEKTKKGHFGPYAALDDIDRAIRSAIKAAEVPLSYSQSTIADLTANGKVVLQVVTDIIHASGETLHIEGMPYEQGTTLNQTMANLTYAKRGSLSAAFGVVADDDDDGQAITALKQEQLKQEEVRKAIIARLKEKLKEAPKEKLPQIFATASMTEKNNNTTDLDKLSANRASLISGAAIFAINDAGIK
ncbi:putative single-strand DNA binding protein [Weissella jogaejeotgali]|uniref:Putative single-strand DNA binding protein n=1 Tax=Weissella jogaejeotgali TaxID=1631871 RepID=A0A1L6R9V4_9LACO|nr:ERF family protein [Weissella jogaejeotgali]APS41290.1 putative single-strand DNA binding protein [Weissella jogaejeotgali]